MWKALRITDDLPGTGGTLKSVPEDFIVEEIPAYPPSGVGQHLLLTVEKRGISTQEMVRRIARALAIPPSAIGVAGQKDQQAITRQVISVPVPAEGPERAANLTLEGARILSAARHGNKLRTGHLRGNRFLVTLRGVADDAATRAQAILDHLSLSWLPNWFGAQRFGRRGENLPMAQALVRGEARVADRFKRRFLVSAWQAGLFNRFLSQRIEEGLLHRVIAGDVLRRAPSGGPFLCAANELMANQARLDQRQIVPTGPMFGSKMFEPAPDSPAAARERRILDEEGIGAEQLQALGGIAEGARRPLLVQIETPAVRQEQDRLLLSFALPSGSYATVLLDEIMKTDQGIHPIVAPESGD